MRDGGWERYRKVKLKSEDCWRAACSGVDVLTDQQGKDAEIAVFAVESDQVLRRHVETLLPGSRFPEQLNGVLVAR